MKNNTLIFFCHYENPNEKRDLKKIELCRQDKILEVPTKGGSLEKQWLKLAMSGACEMPGADFKNAWFRKDIQNWGGLYRNLSRLIIPIPNSKNYYKVSFFS